MVKKEEVQVKKNENRLKSLLQQDLLETKRKVKNWKMKSLSPRRNNEQENSLKQSKLKAKNLKVSVLQEKKRNFIVSENHFRSVRATYFRSQMYRNKTERKLKMKSHTAGLNEYSSWKRSIGE